MDKAAITLVFTFSIGLRLQSKAALGLAVSRLIEERIGLAEGMADVRKWLLIISKPLLARLQLYLLQGSISQAPRRHIEPHDAVIEPCQSLANACTRLWYCEWVKSLLAPCP